MTAPVSRSAKIGWFIAGGLLVALVLAGVVSNYASSHPDGLDSATLEGCTLDDDGTITGGTCAAQGAQDHEFADSPLADYGIRGIGNSSLSTGLSGVLGVLITFVLGGGIFWLVRRSGSRGEVDGTGGERGANSADPAHPSVSAGSR